MSQALTVKMAGLYTFPSDLSSVPDGALSQADNIVIDQDNTAAPRRGFGYLTHGSAGSAVQSSFSNSAYVADKEFFYQGYLLAHYGPGAYYSGTTWMPAAPTKLAYHDPTAGWQDYAGTINRPSSTVPMRFALANQNLYFTTSTGVQKLDSYGGTPAAIGVPAGLDLIAAVSTSSATWLANNFRTAYRIVWGIKDANQNLILGAPSQRFAYTNTAGSTKALDVTFTIPQGITTAHFYQIYRSTSTDNTSTVVEPNDEGGLVYEGNPTSGNLSAGTITVTDVVPDALIGATIYTAASQEGLTAANYPPPKAFDLAVFRNSLFFANTTSFQTLYLTLLGVGSPNGVQNGDTLTIGGVVFTAASSETISSGDFQAVTSGTAAQNIRDTSLSLCRVINRYASSTFYAYYLSTVDDLPGQIMLQTRSAGASAFIVSASRAQTYNPDVGTTNQTSTADTWKNAIFYSKTSEPEAVPLGNYILIGSADKAILRILPLRDSLFILKEDGIFRLYGTDPSNFLVSPLDYTAILIAPETAVVLNNQIWALTTQGVVAISETGVQIMSHPIEANLTGLETQNYAVLQSTSFGISYESDRAYYLFVLTNGADAYPTQYYRYNYITNTWVRGIMSKTCGIVNPIDSSNLAAQKLYLGNGLMNIVDVENKNLTYSDYADYGSTQTISGVNGTVVTMTSVDTIAVGSIIYQSPTVFGTVASVDTVAGTVTTTLATSLAAGSADVLAPISCAITWIPVTLGNPGIGKQLRLCSLLFLSDFNGSGTVGFVSDVSPNQETEAIAGGNVGGWGLSAWGGPFETPLGVPWGGANRRRPIPVQVPRNHQRSTLLAVSFQHAYGYSPWLLQGLSLVGNNLSERVAS